MAPSAGSPPDGRKVLLLTGAAGRLGTAFCRTHAADYDIIAVTHLTPLQVTSNRQRFIDPLRPGALAADAHPVFEVRADLTCSGDIDRVIEVTLGRHDRIDVVVNAVGTAGRGLLLGAGVGQAAHAFGVNATAPIELAVRITEAYWGHHDADSRAANRCVVNVGAAAAVDVAGGRGAPAFSASKAALTMLSAHLAVELEPFGVRVNTIAPAPFPEPITTARVVSGLRSLIEGDDTGRILLLWEDTDELV